MIRETRNYDLKGGTLKWDTSNSEWRNWGAFC